MRLHVFGVPATKGSTRSFPHRVTGKIVTLPMSKSLREWERAIAYEARMSGATFEGPVKVAMTFDLPMPKAEQRVRWHHVRPDLDKLVRAVLDGLQMGGAFADDGQVAWLTAQKRTSRQAGVIVEVRDVDALPDWDEVDDALRS